MSLASFLAGSMSWGADMRRGKKRGGKSGGAKKRKADEMEAEVAGADAVLGDRSKVPNPPT